MKGKRILIIMMCLLVLFSAACSTNSSKQDKSASSKTSSSKEDRLANLNLESQFPVVKEQITLTVMGSRSAAQGDWADLKFFKVLQERSNIKLEFITVPSENWEERKNLAFASDNLPDIFYGCVLTTNDQMVYGYKGILFLLRT